jgi:hypothetical protein
MSQPQVMRRIASRIAQHPLGPETINFPMSIRRVGKLKAVIKRKRIKFEDHLSVGAVLKSFQRTLKTKIKSKTSMLKLSCHPGESISAAGINTILKGWEHEGWVPDIVIVDYADVLSANDTRMDKRDAINQTWITLRAISQSYHCLVVTATQTDAKSYDAKVLSRRHFTEDKRKYGHVTGMVGLNQDQDEYKRGIMRLNWVIPLRDAPRTIGRMCYVAECRSLASPVVRAAY